MQPRSYLFVPGNRPGRFGKAVMFPRTEDPAQVLADLAWARRHGFDAGHPIPTHQRN